MVELDEYQQKVVNSDAKDIIVLSGAGSGKTRTLIERVNHLIDTGVDPFNILVLTFTNAAADEMSSRYYSTHPEDSISPYFNTFHGFCYRLIYESNDILSKLGYGRFPELVESEEAEYDICHRAKNISGCTLSDKKLSNPDDLSFKERTQYDNYLAVLKRMLRKENIITFDILNSGVCKLFKDNDPSIRYIKEQYKYIFVDEFQDVDPYQLDFVMSMKDAYRVLVGDVLQNIYQFRGCSNKPLKRLIRNDNWEVYELPKNYRSTGNICYYVNSFVSTSKYIDKACAIDMITDNDFGDPVMDYDISSAVPAYNWKPDMFQYYIDTLKDILNGFEGTTAILFRTNNEVNSFIRAYQYMLSDNIYVGTIHSVKGLEFENVVVMNVRSKMFSIKSEEGENLFYVACTRAKKKLAVFSIG